MLKKLFLLAPVALILGVVAAAPVSAETVIVKKGHHRDWHPHHDHDKKVIIKR